MMWSKKKEESESEEESDGSETVESGPKISMIPSILKDTACTINPSKPIGLRLSQEGWVNSVQVGTFAERSNVRIGTRVVRVQTSRGWNMIESINELKHAIKNSKNFGDEELVVVLSGILKGEMKWQGGVKAPNGLIYGIPSNTKEVLCLNPTQEIVTTFGQLEPYDEISQSNDYSDSGLWFNGVYSKSTNKIYGIPFNASQFIEIDPMLNTVKRISNIILMGKNKWRGGVSDMYGRIHCIPADSNSVIMYDPKLLKWEIYGNLIAQGSNKWYDGCYCKNDDRILAIPFDADCILMIDPEYKVTSLLFENDILLKGYGKWSGGVVTPNDDCIYCIPYNATFVLKIDPKARTLLKLEGELKGYGKWNGGVLAPDGCIYGIPYQAETLLKINPMTQEVSTVGSVHATKGRIGLWRGGVLGDDGNVYGIPCDSPAVLKLDTYVAPSDEDFE
eukprot:CAMPEP_0114346264 /NCGR_PEP_ID=MMETSP0101-20121206/12911_1 /TAXON_ID=38822 ORGANISM="Pteridomonas danica, Strain PT" /NCGR_SAMPLE_ID=MMETSP0101 /ASSEMBLY_ACC=CAM_ASM_000211 /LENGTH=447 /DNA_ID=CAMNT_0001482769 /DNA_START=232 /DNA_END=1575 /DNA_ORIENTATION=-